MAYKRMIGYIYIYIVSCFYCIIFYSFVDTKELTIFYQMCKYFRSSVSIYYEFCVFDLNYRFSFIFIPSYRFLQNARLQRPNGETRNILPTIIEIIDISHD